MPVVPRQWDAGAVRPGREGCTGVRLSCWAQLAILPRELK
nr:MAG TPA: hypothetical protein [Caudoviricetes sp.]